MIFNFYFINFFQILTLNAPKKYFFLENRGKIVKKKEMGRTKMAFWAFKSQNLEKVYKIKIKNNAILHLLRSVFNF